jgi:hypothetical protein
MRISCRNSARAFASTDAAFAVFVLSFWKGAAMGGVLVDIMASSSARE